jgi:hypothetical protein
VLLWPKIHLLRCIGRAIVEVAGVRLNSVSFEKVHPTACMPRTPIHGSAAVMQSAATIDTHLRAVETTETGQSFDHDRRTHMTQETMLNYLVAPIGHANCTFHPLDALSMTRRSNISCVLEPPAGKFEANTTDGLPSNVRLHHWR